MSPYDDIDHRINADLDDADRRYQDRCDDAILNGDYAKFHLGFFPLQPRPPIAQCECGRDFSCSHEVRP